MTPSLQEIYPIILIGLVVLLILGSTLVILLLRLGEEAMEEWDKVRKGEPDDNTGARPNNPGR